MYITIYKHNCTYVYCDMPKRLETRFEVSLLHLQSLFHIQVSELRQTPHL